ELPFEVTTIQAYNLKNFVSTLFSRNQRNGGLCDSKKAGEKFDRGSVRFSFQSRGVQAKDQFVVTPAAERGFLRVGNDTYLQGERRAHGRPPNKAVPIRTIVAPSSM